MSEPERVGELRLVESDHDEFTVTWAPAVDDVAVTSYQIFLNGYKVDQTTEMSVTIGWLNNDMDSNFVQVRAIDEAGNRSDASNSLHIMRPDPTPPPSPAPDGDPKTQPAQTITPTTSPSPQTTAPANDDPSPTPTAESTSASPTPEPSESAEPTPAPKKPQWSGNPDKSGQS